MITIQPLNYLDQSDTPWLLMFIKENIDSEAVFNKR